MCHLFHIYFSTCFPGLKVKGSAGANPSCQGDRRSDTLNKPPVHRQFMATKKDKDTHLRSLGDSTSPQVQVFARKSERRYEDKERRCKPHFTSLSTKQTRKWDGIFYRLNLYGLNVKSRLNDTEENVSPSTSPVENHCF